MRSLHTVSYRTLRHAKGRYALTGGGIALGVALVFSVLVTSGATTDALERFRRGWTGRADVVAGPMGTFDARLSDEHVAELRALPGVEHSATVSSIRAALPEDGPGSDPFGTIFFVNGIELGEARHVNDFDLAEGRFHREGRVEVVVSPQLADEAGVRLGDTLAVSTTDGVHDVPIVGVLDASGAALASGGRVAYTSHEAVTRLDPDAAGAAMVQLVLADGTDADSWIDDARERFRGEVRVTPASELAAEFGDFLDAVRGILLQIAAIGMFVAGFLVYLTFTIRVAERTRLYGTLRALGATPAQIRSVVVREALGLSVVATAAGLVLGWLLSIASLGFVDSLISSLAAFDVEALGAPVVPGAVAVALGVVVSVLSALVPARRAARLAPVAAMRELVQDARRPRAVWRVGVAAAGTALMVAGPTVGVRAVGAPVLLLGAVLLVPLVVRPLARVLGFVTARFGRGVGDVAVMHLVKERTRSAYTLALVMVVLATILAIGTSNLSMLGTLDEVVDEQFGADLVLFAPHAFDPHVGRELRDIEGVANVTELRFGVTEYPDADHRSAFLSVIDPDTYFEVQGFAWVRGDEASARQALARGGAVLLPESDAGDLGVSPGDRVRLQTVDGPQSFRVAATYGVLGQDPGPVVSLADGERWFNARLPLSYALEVADETDPDEVATAIRSSLGQRYRFNLETAADIKAFTTSVLNGFFSIGYAILLVAAVIGALGLANTLAVSVLERTREIGILRSVGVHRGQLRAMVLAEAATLVLVAYVLGVPLGLLQGFVGIEVFASNLGFTVGYVWPWVLLAPLALLAIVVGLVASLAPARRAGRTEPVVALRFD